MSGILINDNSTAVEAYNNLDATSDMLSSAVNKLSSGLQIQTAADDPAGYLVGQYLQEESNGYGQSISNAQDAVSVLQTAQGALNQEASVLQTMNTLATEAANGGVQDASTSAAAQSEFASLQAELDQIATSTTYGTTPLLGGTYSGETFQVGPYDSATRWS
jgi:flagellin